MANLLVTQGRSSFVREQLLLLKYGFTVRQILWRTQQKWHQDDVIDLFHPTALLEWSYVGQDVSAFLLPCGRIYNLLNLKFWRKIWNSNIADQAEVEKFSWVGKIQGSLFTELAWKEIHVVCFPWKSSYDCNQGFAFLATSIIDYLSQASSQIARH